MLTLDMEDTKPTDEKQKNKISLILDTFSSILIPSLPPVIGGGMIKGFLFMFWEFGWFQRGSPTFQILNIISDGMFYFYPFLLAVSAAKRFKTNEYMALALAGSLMHPSLLEGITTGLKDLPFLRFLSIPFNDYSSSVIPIILSVFLLNQIYRFFQKRIPDILSTIFTPMLTLLVVIPIQLVVLAPSGFYFGQYIAKGIQIIIDVSPVLSGFVIGAARPFLLLTGTHHAIKTMVQQQISTYGYTGIGAMNYMSVIAQAVAPIGVYLIVKDKKMKHLSLSAAVLGFLGITEPSLYSVIVKYKVVFLATALGGGIGGAIASYFGSAEYTMVISSMLTIPATFGEGFIGIAIGIPVTIVVTIVVIFLGRSHIEQGKYKGNTPSAVVDTQPQEQKKSNFLDDKIINIYSPINGKIRPLKSLTDKAYANKLLGKGIALDADRGRLYSPVSGEITVLYPSYHAIGIKTNEGVELFIHIGIDTINLEGKYFTPKVKAGDIVKVGDELLEFDKIRIEVEGYDSCIILMVTNSQDFLDVSPIKQLGKVIVGEKLVRIL